MKLRDTSAIAFNLAGAGIIVTVIGYAGYSFFSKPAIEPCSHRYNVARQLALTDASGQPLSIGQIEARLNWDQRGITQNASIVKTRYDAGAQPASALKIKLDQLPTEDDEPFGSGISFFWDLGDNAEVQAACLSYKVYYPSQFKFGTVGQLPGLVSKTKTSTWSSQELDQGFKSNVVWSRSGEVGVMFSIADRPRPALLNSSNSQRWPTGRWVDVEQEVILNGDGKANGLIRLWVDGQLQINRAGFALRPKDSNMLTGTSISVGYRYEMGPHAILGLSAPVVQTR